MIKRILRHPSCPDINSVCMEIERGVLTDTLKDILSHSLFYYCCGKDPTPIIGLQDKFPLYVYSDIYAEKQVLYERLRNKRFTLKAARALNLSMLDHCAAHPELTLWETPCRHTLMLLFMPMDSVKAFKILYSHEGGQIHPECICNIKYEMDTSFFSALEEQVRYILGHCYSKNHRCIDKLDYFGDYGSERVKLYRKHQSYTEILKRGEVKWNAP